MIKMFATAPSIPSGSICVWSGAIADIPDGWALCDGNNGTPDLRNNFVIGAGDTYDPDDNGGEASHSHSVTELPTTQPSTTQSIVVDTFNAAGADHTHKVSGDTDAAETLPPYYALAYIMKL